jgi:hypothetical protein
MDAQQAYDLVCETVPYETGAFYGGGQNLAIGAGLFFNNLKFPLFDSGSRLFRTVRGVAYVVTHECDTAQDNDRIYNESMLVCPVINFEIFLEECRAQAHPNIGALLGNMAKRNVPRLLFVPSDGAVLPYGGVLYLNRITSTHLSAFEESQVERIGAVSATGLREVDSALQNLLMREKSDRLWGSWGQR